VADQGDLVALVPLVNGLHLGKEPGLDELVECRPARHDRAPREPLVDDDHLPREHRDTEIPTFRRRCFERRPELVQEDLRVE